MPTFTHLSILTKPVLALLGQSLLKNPTKQNLTSCQSLLYYAKASNKDLGINKLFMQSL